MYKVELGNKNIGYISEKQEVDSYINSIIESEKNVAFVDFKEDNINYELQLVNRNEYQESTNLKDQVKDNIEIQYTTYAITNNGKNITYASTMEDAEMVIDSLKEQKKQTDELGILQVYSSNYEEIKPEDIDDITKKVENEIEENKNSIKVAKVNNTVKKINTSIFTVKPISGTITSRYGYRSSPGGIGSTNHKGLDISAKHGSTIKAAATGTVKFAGYKGSLGKLVIIESGNGIETYYGHCSALYVSKGQKVSAGDKIAAVGKTGAATGPHLHLEIHVNGKVVNPQKYIY